MTIETKRPHYYRETDFGQVEPVYELEKDGKCYSERWKHHTNILMRFPWWRFWRPTKVLISTVFLAIDHAFGDGPPVLYETMVFGSDANAEDRQWRYTTRAKAVCGHAAIVKLVQHKRWRRLDALPYLDPCDAK